MKFIPFETKTGAENMQIDSDLLDNAIKERDFGDAEEIAESYVSEHETIYTVTVTMNGETTKIRYSI